MESVELRTQLGRSSETIEKGHGRIETRRALVIDDPAVLAWIQERHAWPGLRGHRHATGERRSGDARSSEDRSYLLSRPLAARALGDAVRSHGGIENQVHDVLDVTVHEDQRRIRAGHAAANFAVLRHSQRVPGAELRSAVALTLLRQATTKRKRIKGRRLKAAWDTESLLQVLTRV